MWANVNPVTSGFFTVHTTPQLVRRRDRPSAGARGGPLELAEFGAIDSWEDLVAGLWRMAITRCISQT